MTTEFAWLWAAAACYVAAGALAIIALVINQRPGHAVFAIMAAGLALHTVSLALRWIRLGHGPFITLFEVLSSNVWSLTLVFLLASWRVRAVRPAAAVVAPVLFVMVGWLLLASPGDSHLPPTYHTLLLYFHVGLGKVFLGAALVAVGIAGIILLRSVDFAAPRLAALPDNTRLEELAFRFMVLGFVFETSMLIAGAVWAQDAWGRYWAWDPLETWSFVTWLTLAFFIHLRVTVKLGPRGSAALIMAVFVLAFLTLFGVPFVSTAPHQGAV